jgi:hypothetical protein
VTDTKARALQYVTIYTQAAQRLLKQGYCSLSDRSDLARCEAMIALAVAARVLPSDALPEEYVAKVDRALARMDMCEASEICQSAGRWN